MATRLPDGDTSFPRGVNSGIDPRELGPGYYHNSMNTVNRGGIVQCRPGYLWHFNLPDGNLQGAFFYEPKNAMPQILFAVDGFVYVSDIPFTTFRKLPNIQFDSGSPFVYWCRCEQSKTLNADGSVALITPRTLVMMQDGLTPPAYYDGSKSEHLRGSDETPLGGPMVWTGDRLWVARGERIFASDIVDPIHFTEGKYFSSDTREEEVFIVPGRVTAMAEVPGIDTPQLLVFTAKTTTAFQSNIRARSKWSDTDNFQHVIFPNIGCEGHKTTVVHNGLLWWYSSFGLTSFNSALLSKQNSKFDYQDLEMSASKAHLHSNMKSACAASYENYLLVSVPFTDFLNQHTWVLDNSVVDLLAQELPAAWNGYWTGTRPVEWCGGSVDGNSRLFHVSKDYDGKNRLWEAFSSERRDSGCDITWTVDTRAYNVSSVALKQIKYAEILLSEILGEFSVRGFWAGTRGRFKSCLTKKIVATEGILEANTQFETAYALKPQSRNICTEEIIKKQADDLSSCGVEADHLETIDNAFQFRLVCVGPGALRAIRVYMDEFPEKDNGACEKDEAGIRAVRWDGGASLSLPDLEEAPEFYTSSKTVTLSVGEVSFTEVGISSNFVSQESADRVATQIATRKAEEKLIVFAEPITGGDLA